MAEVWSSLTTRVDNRIMYNGGLRSRGVDTIVVHHNVTTNPQIALDTWAVGSGSGTSAHYEITDDAIIGAVGENYIAYHAGGTGPADPPRMSDPNGRSIGLEHVNSTGEAGGWQVSDATTRRSGKLIADICRRYNLPINRNTIKLHREITATACPGGLDIDKLVRYAQEAAGQKPVSTPAPSPQSTNKVDQVLEVGSTVKIPGNFSLDDLVNYPEGSSNWYAVSNALAIPPVDAYNYIPIEPLVETNDKGVRTTDQDFANAGHSYFNFDNKTFKVMAVDADSDTAKVNVGGRSVWMKAGPLVEV